MAAFHLGRLCWIFPRGCDLHPIRGWDIFQNFLVSECSQGLHHTLKLQHTICQLVRLIWGQWLGFFYPMLEGLCVGQGLLGLHPGCQIAYPGGAGISPCLGSGVPAVWNGHYPPLMHDILMWVPERMSAPSWKIPGHHLGWELPWVLTTRPICLPAVCTTWSIWFSSGGEGWGVEVCWRLSPHCYTSQRHLISSQEILDAGIKREKAFKVLHFWSGPVRWVAWSLFSPHRLAGGALPCQHPSLGYFQMKTEWRLPAILIKKDWVTWVTFEQGPHGAMSPGGLWFDDLESGTFAGSCPSAFGFQNFSDCSWESSSTSWFCLPKMLWLSIPVSGHLSLWPEPLCRSPASHPWICPRWCSSWGYSWLGGQACGHWLGSTSVPPPSSVGSTYAGGILCWSPGSLGGYTPPSPCQRASSPVTFTAGTLCSISAISSVVDSGLTSSTADGFASRSLSTDGSHLPWQMAWSYSLSPWPQHGGTSSVVGTGGEAHWVPTTGVLWDMHPCWTASLLLSLICHFPLQAFLQQWFLLCDSHTINWVVHGN